MIYLVFLIGAERTWLFSMPPKLNSFISLLDTIFHTTMISSSKTLNSNLHLFLIFSVFLFLVIFLGKITLLILSNLFLPVEMLRHSLFTIAITMDTALLNSLVAYLSL